MNILGGPLNRPIFCPTVGWQANAETFANSSTIGANISGVFINRQNTIYHASQTLRQILVWLENNGTVSRTIPFNRSSLAGLYVTSNGDIYLHVGQPVGQVERYSVNSSNPTTIMNVSMGVCFGLAITENGTLYCSLGQTSARVIRTTLGNTAVIATVAGDGIPGVTATRLISPYGIFVDTNFSLYVADFGNNRIQLFQPGQLSATTVAGTGAANTITLFRPTFVALDGNGYLYILDFGNHRVVGSGPNGFQCVAACTGSLGSAANQLNQPSSFTFDSYGNIWVTDMANGRIQKFILATNSCGKIHDCQTIQ
ncbi:MAG: hypothetical protein HC788_08330 [Sphingopyxis sp.]|nr:hypothetical protein [Sphingopyxis sp.]